MNNRKVDLCWPCSTLRPRIDQCLECPIQVCFVHIMGCERISYNNIKNITLLCKTVETPLEDGGREYISFMT